MTMTIGEYNTKRELQIANERAAFLRSKGSVPNVAGSMTLPTDNRVGRNCGVTAVAVMAGVSFTEAWNELKAIRSAGSRWTGATSHADRQKALTGFGVSLSNITVPRTTLSTFIKKHAKAGVRYMVRTTGHVQIVLDGMVLDQLGNKPVAKYWGSKKMVSIVSIIAT